MPVPASAAEQVFRDIQSHTDFVPHLREVQVLRPPNASGAPIQLGTHWREVLAFRGKCKTLYKTITQLTESNHGDKEEVGNEVTNFSLTVFCDFGTCTRVENRDATETYSIEIRPMDDSKCLVLWTFAFISAGLLNTLRIEMFKRRLAKALKLLALEKMECYSKEAERRHWREPKEQRSDCTGSSVESEAPL